MRLRNGKVRFQILASFRDRIGSVDAEIAVTNQVAVFVDSEDPDCRITLRFASQDAAVEQAGECSRMFGIGVTAAGAYHRSSSTIPLFDF